jgi:hypothetical protein
VITPYIINPRHACAERDNYSSRSVCPSVTTLTATYLLVYEYKVQCREVPYGVPNACIVYISLKTLRSPVLASFADCKLLDFPQATWPTMFYLYVKSYTIYGMYIDNGHHVQS